MYVKCTCRADYASSIAQVRERELLNSHALSDGFGFKGKEPGRQVIDGERNPEGMGNWVKERKTILYSGDVLASIVSDSIRQRIAVNTLIPKPH